MTKGLFIAAFSVLMGYSVIGATKAPQTEIQKLPHAAEKPGTFIPTPSHACAVDPINVEKSYIKCLKPRKEWLHI